MTNATAEKKMAVPTLEEMLKAGVHFGHQASRRHPKMKPYIFTKRNNIHVIDLESTQTKLVEALDFVRQIVANGGVILFVASKKQARQIVKESAERSGMPYIVGRWIGGIFTNFDQVGKLLTTLKRLETEEKDGTWQRYTKGEQMDFKKQQNKLREFVGGIQNMTKLPKAIFVIDIKKEKTAIAEANKKNIPIIAMTDTNVNPSLVQYPIPSNDDAMSSIALIANCVADTIVASREAAKAKQE